MDQTDFLILLGMIIGLVFLVLQLLKTNTDLTCRIELLEFREQQIRFELMKLKEKTKWTQ